MSKAKFGKQAQAVASKGVQQLNAMRMDFSGRVKPSPFRGESKTIQATNRISIAVEGLKELGVSNEAISSINNGLKRIRSEEKGSLNEMDATFNSLSEMVNLFNGITLQIEPEYTDLGKQIERMIGELNLYNNVQIENRANKISAQEYHDARFEALKKTEGMMKDIDEKTRAVTETADEKNARIEHENNLRRKFGVPRK